MCKQRQVLFRRLRIDGVSRFDTISSRPIAQACRKHGGAGSPDSEQATDV